MNPKFIALKQDLTGSTVTTFSPSLCVAGATYTFKVLRHHRILTNFRPSPDQFQSVKNR